MEASSSHCHCEVLSDYCHLPIKKHDIGGGQEALQVAEGFLALGGQRRSRSCIITGIFGS